ncbi:MAG: MBG domain-containing protein, partial [Verrucomicrobiota bacterium]
MLRTVLSAEYVVAGPVGAFLRSIFVLGAMGACDTLVGATAVAATISPSTNSPLRTDAGVAVNESFGTSARILPSSWLVTGTIPPGLDLNGLTTPGTAPGGFLQLSGTPTVAGTYNFSLTAVSGGNKSSSLNYQIIVAPTDPPVVGSPATAGGTVGQSFFYTITASNTPTSYGAGGLPAGLTLNATTGVISGTPSATGTFSTTISATNRFGTDTGSVLMTIAPGAATVTLGGLTQTYNGALRPATVTTIPAGLAVTVTYADTTTIAPTNAGNYSVLAVVTDANRTGSASGTLVISKAAATLTLSGLSQTFNGAPRPVTVTTSPAALPVTVTYAGTTTIAPTVPGSYPVVATVSDPNATGTKSGTLVIAKAPQTITFGALVTQTVGNAPLTLSGMASSGLTVSFSSSNAAVTTVSGSTLTIVGKGTAIITASQAGNTNFLAASNVTQTLTVVQPPSFTASVANRTVVAGKTVSFAAVTAGSSPITLQWQSAPAGSDVFTNLTNSASFSGVTTATLTVTATGSAVANSGLKFRCLAGNSGATNVASTVATLTVTPAPATVTLGALTQTFSGAPRPATVTTSPVGLPVTVTYA